MKYILLMLLTVYLNAYGITTMSDAIKAGTLFSTNEAKDFELTAPFTTLFEAKKLGIEESKKMEVNGILEYAGSASQKISIPVKIRLKGFSTLHNCRFPKLELRILRDSSAADNLFSDVDTVDLNTHCDHLSISPSWEFENINYFNHRETAVYKIAQALEIPTLRTRTAFMIYKDSDMPSKLNVEPNKKYQAFFLEDFSDFRRKRNLRKMESPSIPLKNIDREDIALITLLQFLIGNRDWFINARPSQLPNFVTLANIKPALSDSGKVVLVAQDFNQSYLLLGRSSAEDFRINTFNIADREHQLSMMRYMLGKKIEILKAVDFSQNDMREEMKRVLLIKFNQIERRLDQIR